jgi:predicted  nucleic acid-binding Zn-ribbon protein
MNEEERRLEILKAEAAIRELARRMAEAGEYTRQADMARSALEAADRSIDELNIEFHALIESHRGALEEESKTMNQALESLDICAKDLQKAQERFEKKAENLETSIEKKHQEFYEMMDAKLDNLSQDINETKDQFIIVANKLLFVMDQNEALNKRMLALQRIIDELSCKFQGFGNVVDCNSEKIQELRVQVIDSNEKLSSLKYDLEAKTSGLVHRLRSAIRWSWS